MSVRSLFRRQPAARPMETPAAAAAQGVRKSQMPVGSPGEFLPVVAADDIIDHYSVLIEQLRSELNHSQEEFRALIYPTLRNLADFFQVLPASEQDHHSDLGGSFRHAVEVALCAVRLAYSKEITGRAQEGRSNIEERMRVAVCMAGLVHDCGKPVTDMTISATIGGVLAVWSPFAGSIAQWANDLRINEYRMEWVSTGRHKRHEVYTGMFGLRLVDTAALSYVSEAGLSAVFQLWEGAIGNIEGRSLLQELVKEADHSVSLEDLKSHRNKRKGGVEGHRADRFVAMIRENVDRMIWRVNEPGSFIWLTDRGCFITWPVAMTHVLEALKEKGDLGYPSNPEEIAQWLLDRRLANRYFEPGKGNRDLWPFAPARLLNDMKVAVVLWGIQLGDVELIFGDRVPAHIDLDLIPEIHAGRLQATGARLNSAARPAALSVDKRKPEAPVADAVKPAEENAAIKASGSSKSKRPKDNPAPPETDSIASDSDDDAVVNATSWLKGDTGKGRVLVREILYRIVQQKDEHIVWLRDAWIWRDRLVVRWPEAIDDMGFDPASALRTLAEHNVLHHETMKGDNGWTHSVNQGGNARKVVAFNEATTRLLLPLIEHYCTDKPSDRSADVATLTPPTSIGSETCASATSTSASQSDTPAESSPPGRSPAVTAIPPTAQRALPGASSELEEREGQIETFVEGFAEWVGRRGLSEFTMHQAVSEAAQALGVRSRFARRALMAAECPAIMKTENGLYRLNEEHPGISKYLRSAS